jgi:hypothetical protein
VSTSSRDQIACRTPGCPRQGMPAGYVESETPGAPDEVRGGPCPACSGPTDPEPAEPVTAWSAPSWSSISRIDGDLLHSWLAPELVIGIDQDGGPDGHPLQLELAQCDRIHIDQHGARVFRGAVWIQIEDLALSIGAAEHLTRVLRDLITHYEAHTQVSE